jgi:hypothetical protein
MKLERILPFARRLLEQVVGPGDIAIDATLGNGHDTAFLAQLVGETGIVFGFDIQEEAIQSTTARLEQLGLSQRAVLYHKGHEHIHSAVPKEYFGKIKGAIFNLGYLPGGDKSIVTKSQTTIAAIQQLLDMMDKEAVIVLVIYHGHEEGALERDELLQFVKNLDQQKAHVLQYQFINQVNHPPFIVAIEKR